MGSALYFVAQDSTAGAELWKSDGTAAGTVRIADIRPGSAGSSIQNLTAAGSQLYFTADTGSGRNLWTSNGMPNTTDGTSAVSVPGAINVPKNLTAVGSEIYFSATTRSGWALFGCSDGKAGAVLVKEDSLRDDPTDFTAVGSSLYFLNSLGSLWKSDGTLGGTSRVEKNNEDGVSYPSAISQGSLTAVGSTLFFSGGWVSSLVNIDDIELWKSYDGKTFGAGFEMVRVRDILAGDAGSHPQSLTAVGSTLYFTADDGTSGRELWRSRGTAASTIRVGDIQPGMTGSNPSALTAVGDTLYFTADDGINGVELWRSDGTADGTLLVKDIRPGTTGSGPTSLTAVGDTLYFAADDGVNGVELWRSDGTAAGTVLVKDIQPGTRGSGPTSLAAVGDTLFFSADDGIHGSELWVVRPNAAPTDVNLTGTSIAENLPAGTVVGTLSSTDPDAGDTFTYTLVSGTGSTDNASFQISGNELRATASLDFDTKNCYLVRVRSTDQGGLTFENVFAITVTQDTTPPAPPVIVRVIDDVPRFVGNVLPGGLTNDNRLRVVGTAEPGSTVALRNGVTNLGTAIATAQGSWEITTSTLADGGQALTAIATDADNNSSSASEPSFGFTVDTVGPATPIILAVTDNVGAVTGNVASGSRTDDTTLRIVGTAAPMSRVIVRSGNAVLRTVFANSSGEWAVVTDPLQVRLHNLNAVAQDEAGNNSAASGIHTVTIDQTSPAILSFGSTTSAGSYGQGSEIAIFARTSERMRAGSAIDVTLNTGAVVRLSTSSERSELNGTYRVAADASASPLSIVSVANVSPIASDIAGNLVAGLPSMPVVLAGINVT